MGRSYPTKVDWLLAALMVLPVIGSAAALASGSIHVPFDRLIKAELSRNLRSSPALPLRRINVEYRKPNGKDTFVLISPPDRERFLADLVALSERHKLVDGKVVES